MSTPLSYYRNLRFQDLAHEVVDGSRVVRTTNSEGESVRLLEITQFTFLTSARSTTVSSSRATYDAGAFMAARHFNDRNDVLVPGLSERLEGCDLYVTLEMQDSKISRIESSRALISAHSRQHSLASPVPGGIVGSYSSSITAPLATLTGAYGTPHVGGIATAQYLDEKDKYPTYARTNASARAIARGVVELLKYWGVKKVACVYIRSEYSTSLFEKIQDATREAGIELISTNYEAKDGESADLALQKIQDSGLRYIVGVLSPSSSNVILERAHDKGMAGVSDFQWVVPIMGRVGKSTYTLDLDQYKYAKALSGVASVDAKTPYDGNFLGFMDSLKTDEFLRNDYIDSHPEAARLFDGFNWTTYSPSRSSHSYSNYDAMMALALSACEAENDFFTPQEHWVTLLKTTFKGASGHVGFELKTASRDPDGIVLEINNILPDLDSIDKGNSEKIKFLSRPSMLVDFSRRVSPLNEIEPYVFGVNASEVPKQFPPIREVGENRIPEGAKIFGWVMCGLLMTMSVLFAVYAYRKHLEPLIRKAQPVFLEMMCFGTFVLASAIVPLSLQDSEGIDADAACMAVPWLVTIGFSTAFSAIFTKTWRINRLYQEASAMNRVEIHAKDVIWPFALLSTVNVTLLTLMTTIAPLQHDRVADETNFDQFGRSLENYGICRPSNDTSVGLLITLGVFNFLVVVFANYQCWVGRDVPHHLSEKGYIAFTMASFLECFLVGGPILYFVSTSPTADFVVKVILILFTSLAILLPMFLPKMLAKDDGEIVVNALHSAFQRQGTRVGSGGSSGLFVAMQEKHVANESSKIMGSSVAELRERARAKSSLSASEHSSNASEHLSSTRVKASHGSEDASTESDTVPSTSRERFRRPKSRGSLCSEDSIDLAYLPSSVRELQRRVSSKIILEKPAPC